MRGSVSTWLANSEHNSAALVHLSQWEDELKQVVFKHKVSEKKCEVATLEIQLQKKKNFWKRHPIAE